jgi:hypothetical protein
VSAVDITGKTVRTARVAKCTKRSGLLATPISRSVLGASSRAHRIKCSWFNTSSCRVNAAIRSDADSCRKTALHRRLVSLPTMNVQRQPHGFHDAVRLHAILCVVCIVYRCCAWCATHLSAESYNADAVAFGRPHARHLALFPLTARRSADRRVLCRRTKPTTHKPLLPT